MTRNSRNFTPAEKELTPLLEEPAQRKRDKKAEIKKFNQTNQPWDEFKEIKKVVTTDVVEESSIVKVIAELEITGTDAEIEIIPDKEAAAL
jgi:hypothetical protein